MIQQTKALTARPFGIDLIFEDTAFGPCTTVKHIEVCLAERVRVVVFFWHLPPADWVARLQAAGVKVWMTVGSVQQAYEAVNAQMDAVIAQGSEAGGHNKSLLALSSLIPAVADAVAPLPVVAAGGIADGRGVAAALALGAEAVCVGTRLVASREAFAHDEYKRRVVAATVDDIARTSIFGPEWPDQPMKVIRNRVVREWAGRDDKTPPAPELQAGIGRMVLFSQEYPMPKFSAVLPTPHATGDFEEMCLAATACMTGRMGSASTVGVRRIGWCGNAPGELVPQDDGEGAIRPRASLPGGYPHQLGGGDPEMCKTLGIG